MRDIGGICFVLSMDELVIAVVLSEPFFLSFFLYSAPSSGIY